MAAPLKYKRTPITTPPYQVPSVDVTPDPPFFSLVTTFKDDLSYNPSLLKDDLSCTPSLLKDDLSSNPSSL